MPIIPLRGLGSLGVVADSQGQALPIGAWDDARNIRFSGLSIEKMYEPTLEMLLPDSIEPDEGSIDVTEAKWLQGWSDGQTTYFAVAVGCEDGYDYLLFWQASSASNGEWVVASDAIPPGRWQSFEWGDTCVFNNGNTAPKIFDNDAIWFIDLPGWGLISTADDLTTGEAPSRNTAAKCDVILPYKSFLVALGITEGGTYQPNTVWWSDSTPLVGLRAGALGTGGPPDWDYESPGSLSGKAEVGAGSGKLTWGAALNESLICYTDGSATAMTLTGGPSVMGFRRMFNKGCAGKHLAVEYNNAHFVLARDQLYVHDGSTVKLIAKDRVENEFFTRAGKGGRFGTGNIDFNSMQLALNPERKEITLVFGETLVGPLDYACDAFNTEVLSSLDSTRILNYVSLEQDTGAPSTLTDDSGNGHHLTANLGTGLVLDDSVMDACEGVELKRISIGGAASYPSYHEAGSAISTGQLYEGGDHFSAFAVVKLLDRYYSNGGTFFRRQVVAGTSGYNLDIRLYQNGQGQLSLSIYGYSAVNGANNYRSTAYVDAPEAWANYPSSNEPTWFVLGFDYITNADGSDTINLYINGRAAASLTYPEGVIRLADGDPGTFTSIDFTWGRSSKGQATWSAMKFARQAMYIQNQPPERWAAIGGAWRRNFESYDPETDPQTGPQYYRGGLVYNFEDDNYTWMDASVDYSETVEVDEGEFETYTYLDPVHCMHYAFDPGWVVRWSDLQSGGTQWDGLQDAGTRWSDFYYHGGEKNMYWLTPAGVWRSDQVIKTDSLKQYTIERDDIDLDDVVQQWNSSNIKYAHNFYFHLESPSLSGTDPNNFTFAMGAKLALQDSPTWGDTATVNLQETPNGGKHKVDFRATGRYLSMQMTFNATQAIKMSGGELFAEESHGR